METPMIPGSCPRSPGAPSAPRTDADCDVKESPRLGSFAVPSLEELMHSDPVPSLDLCLDELEERVIRSTAQSAQAMEEHHRELRRGFVTGLCLLFCFAGCCVTPGGHAHTGRHLGVSAGVMLTGFVVSTAGLLVCMLVDDFFVCISGGGAHVLGLLLADLAFRRWRFYSNHWDQVRPPPRGALPGGCVEALKQDRFRCGVVRQSSHFAAPFPVTLPLIGLPDNVRDSDFHAMVTVINRMRDKAQCLFDLWPVACFVLWAALMLLSTRAMRAVQCEVFHGQCISLWIGSFGGPTLVVALVCVRLILAALRRRELLRVNRFLALHSRLTGLGRRNLRWILRDPVYALCFRAPELWLVADENQWAVSRLGWLRTFRTHCTPAFQRQVRTLLLVHSRPHPCKLPPELLLETLGFLHGASEYKP